MSEKKLDGKIPLESVLLKFKENNKKFRDNLEREEQGERIETLDSITNDIKATKISTTLKTNQFINEIKGGLGDKVRSNPNGIKFIKKKWYKRFGDYMKKIFTKF